MALNDKENQNLQPQNECLFEELSDQEQEAVAGGLSLNINLNQLLNEIPKFNVTVPAVSGTVTINGQPTAFELQQSTVGFDNQTLTVNGFNVVLK